MVLLGRSHFAALPLAPPPLAERERAQARWQLQQTDDADIPLLADRSLQSSLLSDAPDPDTDAPARGVLALLLRVSSSAAAETDAGGEQTESVFASLLDSDGFAAGLAASARRADEARDAARFAAWADTTAGCVFADVCHDAPPPTTLVLGQDTPGSNDTSSALRLVLVMFASAAQGRAALQVVHRDYDCFSGEYSAVGSAQLVGVFATQQDDSAPFNLAALSQLSLSSSSSPPLPAAEVAAPKTTSTTPSHHQQVLPPTPLKTPISSTTPQQQQQQQASPSPQVPQPKSCIVTVKNLPPYASEKQVRRIFRRIGAIVQVKLVAGAARSGGKQGGNTTTALVQFETPAQATEAVRRFDGTVPGGFRAMIRVTIARVTPGSGGKRALRFPLPQTPQERQCEAGKTPRAPSVLRRLMELQKTGPKEFEEMSSSLSLFSSPLALPVKDGKSPRHGFFKKHRALFADLVLEALGGIVGSEPASIMYTGTNAALVEKLETRFRNSDWIQCVKRPFDAPDRGVSRAARVFIAGLDMFDVDSGADPDRFALKQLKLKEIAFAIGNLLPNGSLLVHIPDALDPFYYNALAVLGALFVSTAAVVPRPAAARGYLPDALRRARAAPVLLLCRGLAYDCARAPNAAAVALLRESAAAVKEFVASGGGGEEEKRALLFPAIDCAWLERDGGYISEYACRVRGVVRADVVADAASASWAYPPVNLTILDEDAAERVLGEYWKVVEECVGGV